MKSYFGGKLYSLIIVLLIAACSSPAIPTSTPSPTSILAPAQTPIPVPALDVLNWQILFSSDAKETFLKCTILTSDLQNRSLLEPIQMKVTGSLITPQILEETHIIIEQGNPDAIKQFEQQFSKPQSIYLLLRFDFGSELDPYIPYEYSPEFYAGFQFPLNDIKFNFTDINLGIDNQMLLKQTERTHFDPLEMYLPADISAGEIYLIPFDLGELNLSDLGSYGNLILELSLAMLPPFRTETCQNTNNPVELKFNISSGSSRLMPQLYGNLSIDTSESYIDEARLFLLSDALLRKITIPTATPSASPTNTPKSPTSTP